MKEVIFSKMNKFLSNQIFNDFNMKTFDFSVSENNNGQN